MLIHLQNQEIDKKKWDRCIEASKTNLIYAKSWFLDIVSPNWEAIVMDDYDAVMPIPVKFRFGLRYVVHPFYAKQLGVFSNSAIDEVCLNDFFDKLFTVYPYVRIAINRENILNGYKNANIVTRKNHELNLFQTYEKTRKGYKRRAIGNINRANRYGVTYSDDLSFKDFSSFANQNSDFLESKDLKQFLNVINYIKELDHTGLKSKIYGAYNKNNELISVSFYFIDFPRIYCMFNASNNEGKETQAIYLLTDRAIEGFSAKEKILDFTGSDMKGVAHFLESFGAIPFNYRFIEYIKPGSIYSLIKWFKF